MRPGQRRKAANGALAAIFIKVATENIFVRTMAVDNIKIPTLQLHISQLAKNLKIFLKSSFFSSSVFATTMF